MSSEEYERTREIVEEFGKMGGVGEELQRLLLERAKTRENWVRTRVMHTCSHLR